MRGQDRVSRLPRIGLVLRQHPHGPTAQRCTASRDDVVRLLGGVGLDLVNRARLELTLLLTVNVPIRMVHTPSQASTPNTEYFLHCGTTPADLRFGHMNLRAHECRERALDARELARQAKRPSAKNTFERTADYWLALAERVESGERKSIFLAQPVVHSEPMPLVGYLLGVGMALFLGLVSLSAYLEAGPNSAAKLSTAPTSASLVLGTPSQH